MHTHTEMRSVQLAVGVCVGGLETDKEVMLWLLKYQKNQNKNISFHHKQSSDETNILEKKEIIGGLKTVMFG